jgi:hypothetical protein
MPRNTAPPWARNRSARYSASAWRRNFAGRTRCRPVRKSACGCSTPSPTGLRPWFSKFCGTLYDKRWLPVVEDSTAGTSQRALSAQRGADGARGHGLLAADRAILRRRARRAEGGRPHPRLLPGADRGAHPFEMVHDGLLDQAHLAAIQSSHPAEYRGAVRTRSAIRFAFVERGGSIVATYETSLYDEWGVRRADFGLARSVRRILRRQRWMRA